MIKYCDWVKLANDVMEKYKLDGWPPNYVCQEKDCKNCMIYRVAKHDLEAISLHR